MARQAHMRYSLTDQKLQKLKHIKIYFCKVICREINRRRWSQKQAADYLGTSESCVSLVCNYRADQLTFNQLFTYLVILNPGFEILVST